VIDRAALLALSDSHPLNEKQAACYIGMSVHTLRQWRFRGVGPVYVKMGSSVRYLRGTLDSFLESRTVAPQA
jgi:predicted DNA-binding transcriptional regulator AlpA